LDGGTDRIFGIIGRVFMHILSRLNASVALGQLLLCIVLVCAASVEAQAGPREQAYQMFNRLNGVPPTAAALDQMVVLIEAGKSKEAAMAAIEDPGAYFYNLNLKTWVGAWTNSDKTPRVGLNDYTATVVGMARDDVPFDQALYADIIYVAKPGLMDSKGVAIPAYSVSNNDQYVALEKDRINLKVNLVQQPQMSLTGLAESAGVLTTRAFGAAYYSDGTNRRALRFTLLTFLCNDLEQMHDTTRPDRHVRRDVTRDPGGDPSVYKNKCVGCHSGMDALAGAFAFFNYSVDKNQLLHTPGLVQGKYNQNTTEYPNGFKTIDSSWENLWVDGPNSRIGWKGATQGKGVSELGKMMTQTDAFPTCMAKRAYEQMCLHPASSDDDLTAVSNLAKDFSAGGKFSLKGLFAGAAAVCAGK